MKCLIIIPAYNEADNIEKVVDNIIKNYPQYDYVVVNDGSTDATRKVCKTRGYNLLELPVNVGLAGAVKSGIKYANYYQYEYAVQIDGDGQHDPAYIADMLEEMKRNDADIVIGSRFVDEKKPFSSRMFGSNLISLAIWITTGKKIRDVTSGMRLFNKKMIKKFGYQMNYGPEPDTLAFLLNCGVKICEVQVSMQERTAGTSYLTMGRSISYMMHVLYGILVFQWFRKRER
ncbi:glycosyltransferase family 2 protein [Parablautia muri]|uniref:Glycosyltransferase family 2 protein n=1 Tax=Parablautia muri TaxID=2320879 RepID=A0A9X5BCY7_9FIRM|nr:glycosyltransferase family 2 protein [Parablautia muri]NBJ91333.1 glycosyltransferase family 2 protein [Parablautia muri]